MPDGTDLRNWGKRRLIREVEKLRDVLSRTLGASEGFSYESGVNDRGVPFVRFAWGEETAQQTPDETRQMGLALIETAEAAENDAAIVAALTDERFGYSVEMAAGFLVLMREGRAKWKAIARGDAPPPRLSDDPEET